MQSAAIPSEWRGPPMANLIYVTNMTLDGYIEDADGGFDWGPPADDVFTACTDLLGSMGHLPIRTAAGRDDGPLEDRPSPRSAVRPGR